MPEWKVIPHFNAVLRGKWVFGFDEVQDLDLDLGLREVLVVVLHHLQSHRRLVLLMIQALEHLSERSFAKQLHKLIAICHVITLHPRIALISFLGWPSVAVKQLLGTILAPVKNFPVTLFDL